MDNERLSPEARQKKESEIIIGDLRDFISENMPFMDLEKIENAPSNELLGMLMNYWNDKPSYANYYNLIQGGEDDGATFRDGGVDLTKMWTENVSGFRSLFAEYILYKLPDEIRKRYLKKISEDSREPSFEEITKFMEMESDEKNGLVFGLHTSPHDIRSGRITPTQSSDVFSGGAHDIYSKSWYSLNADHLYGDKSCRYLYIVEGAKQDLQSRLYDKNRGAVYTHSPIKIRHKIFLNEQVKKDLGISFANFATI